jgi:gliding motility-associated-like protein
VISYQIVDASGGTQECHFTVTVIDEQLPTIECPEDINQVDPIVIFNDPAYDDNCGATLSQIEGPTSGDVFPHGVTPVTYEVVDNAGNIVTCGFNVLVNTAPVASPDSTSFAESDHNIVIDVTDNDTDDDGDVLTPTSASAQHGTVTINSNGTLTYNVNTAEWCGTDTISYVVCDPYSACDTSYVVITVECYIDIILPEGMSPNGDGINDTFEIIGLEDYPENKLIVFNRWGHKVYEATNYDNTWDGVSQAALTLGETTLPKGTYYYIFQVPDRKPIKGFFYLNK